jgi:hypothetical protein
MDFPGLVEKFLQLLLWDGAFPNTKILRLKVIEHFSLTFPLYYYYKKEERNWKQMVVHIKL